jgi:hypothetical protein
VGLNKGRRMGLHKGLRKGLHLGLINVLQLGAPQLIHLKLLLGLFKGLHLHTLLPCCECSTRVFVRGSEGRTSLLEQKSFIVHFKDFASAFDCN